jgi:hypothetical protein
VDPDEDTHPMTRDPRADRPPLAADLLLLAHDGTTGRRLLAPSHFAPTVAGAVVLDLLLLRVLALADTDDAPVPRGRLHRVVGAPRPDLLLESVADDVHGRTPVKALRRLATRTFDNKVDQVTQALMAQLAGRGMLRHEQRRTFGLLAGERYVAADTTYQRWLVQQLGEVVLEGREPDARTAALVCLLSASDLTPSVLPGVDRRLVRQRAARVADGSWAPAAVRAAVDDVVSALSSAVLVPVAPQGRI